MQKSDLPRRWCITYPDRQSSATRSGPEKSKSDQLIYDPIIAGTKTGSGHFINDRAILRAVQATFKPPELETNPKKTVFVGRLQLTITEDRIRQLFAPCGTIRHLRLVRDLITGGSRGYAFLTFKHSSAVRAAMAMHGNILDGRAILVEPEVGRTLQGWKPRRLGGGFGGRKESGQMRFGGRACPHQTPGTIDSVDSRGRGGRKDSSRQTDRDGFRSGEVSRQERDRSRSRRPRSSHSKRSESSVASRTEGRSSSLIRSHPIRNDCRRQRSSSADSSRDRRAR